MLTMTSGLSWNEGNLGPDVAGGVDLGQQACRAGVEGDAAHVEGRGQSAEGGGFHTARGAAPSRRCDNQAPASGWSAQAAAAAAGSRGRTPAGSPGGSCLPPHCQRVV